MKHLAIIQSEFLRTARNWDDMTVDEQWLYLREHPESKRKLTAKPRTKSQNLRPARGSYWDDPLHPIRDLIQNESKKYRKRMLESGYTGVPESAAELKVQKMIESGEEDTDSYERLLEEELAKEFGNNGEPVKPEINEDDLRRPR